jgi:hypothetical protein
MAANTKNIPKVYSPDLFVGRACSRVLRSNVLRVDQAVELLTLRNLHLYKVSKRLMAVASPSPTPDTPYR